MSNVIQKGQTHSMDLIFFPLIILIIVGLFANELNTSGLQTTPTLPTPYCTGTIEPGECYPTNTNGCDQSLVSCNFTTGTSFSFLSSNSPYTLLLEGNLIGFFNCLTGCPTITPVTNLVFLSGCTNFLNSASDTNFITSLYCGGATFNSGTGVPSSPYNATSSIGNNSNWFIEGSTPPNIAIYGEYKPNGTTFQNKYCDAVGLCYYTNLFTCPTIHQTPYNGTNIQYCLIYVILSSSAPSFNNTFSVFGFVAGIILLLLGLGLTIAASFLGTGATVGVNQQSTRMAQAVGFGLLSWSFVYSEFGTWLGFLPFNLGTIGFIILTTMYFLGLYWRMFAWD